MQAKRARSTSAANCSTASPENTRPAKRLARSVQAAAPYAKRRSSPIGNFSLCPPNVADCPPASAQIQTCRAHSVDPPTPPRLRSLSPHALQRQRARSLDRSPTPLRLTQENLRSFEHSMQFSPMSVPQNPSPTRKNTAITDKKKLAGYNITVDQGIALPAALADFVETLQQAREQEPSPHAQAIIDTRRAASIENEIKARQMMEEHILFQGEGYTSGVKGLALKNQVNLIKDYLPTPPRVTIPEVWGSLARPQPDSCIGYITSTEAAAHTPPFVMPFTREEDDMAHWYAILPFQS